MITHAQACTFVQARTNARNHTRRARKCTHTRRTISITMKSMSRPDLRELASMKSFSLQPYNVRKTPTCTIIWLRSLPPPHGPLHRLSHARTDLTLRSRARATTCCHHDLCHNVQLYPCQLAPAVVGCQLDTMVQREAQQLVVQAGLVRGAVHTRTHATHVRKHSQPLPIPIPTDLPLDVVGSRVDFNQLAIEPVLGYHQAAPQSTVSRLCAECDMNKRVHDGKWQHHQRKEKDDQHVHHKKHRRVFARAPKAKSINCSKTIELPRERQTDVQLTYQE
jgi:hypothetical protein